ncbi:YedE family putative selenium transporter [Lacrimispora sp. 210928-DFI.3.58]|uniref:YedE family putative selenium transporter n=1 Tax=Lacrimispora sp. 210928-DFI.3.58 TaxID=2883214 RepID=UPI0015B5B154|nr:YedE family putative selenium transporter [Lacrimispora sp. 210928-DFI.3.58]MCB7317309.1 YedE-related selenium metabolism membrane protein [Lacrimispora sp. 210928-DFI.3.58]
MEGKMNPKAALILWGGVLGLVAACLAFLGNPGNMAFCIACFIRDMAGAAKFHTAAVVQYMRPEIVGLVIGSFLISLVTKEYRSTAGSSPVIRFLLGMVTMIGALIFLGCPLRMVLRMSAGDLNAYVAFVGFALGAATGCLFLKKGFSLGRAYDTQKENGYILPAILAALFLLSVTTAVFAVSTEGPGSLHAPVIASLAGGLVFGAVSQKSRTCFAGGIRDVILMKNFDLLSVIGGLFLVMLVYNLATGHFSLGFEGQPVAHTESLWNALGMYTVGFAAVLAGGCPLRQLILAGQGSADAAVNVLGMFVGAAVCHNFGLASSGNGTTPAGRIMCLVCIAVLFVIAFTCRRKRS